jgi:hypothetical protein
MFGLTKAIVLDFSDSSVGTIVYSEMFASIKSVMTIVMDAYKILGSVTPTFFISPATNPIYWYSQRTESIRKGECKEQLASY